MFKHQEIIDRLTTEQKLALLADVTSLGSGTKFELPSVRESTLDGLNEDVASGDVYPSFHALANTWDTELVGSVADALMLRAKRKGVNLVGVPNANVKSTPYGDGLSEDPHLIGEMVSACVQAGARVGVKTYVADPSITKTDAAYSDLKLDERALREYFMRPFDTVLKAGVGAVLTRSPKLTGEYEKVNAEWLASIKRPVIYDGRTAQQTMQAVREGSQLCKNGHYNILKEGHERYKKLMQAFEEGTVTLGEVEAECKNGNALSMETIDAAVDKLLNFNMECRKLQRQSSAPKIVSGDMPLQAAEGSIVMLKNEGVLPLRSREKIALIGDPSTLAPEGLNALYKHASELFSQRRIQYVGCARGYDMQKDRSDELLREAVLLSQRADAVVLLLGCDAQGRARAGRNQTSKLPANQIALLEALSKLKVKIVAIVCGESYPDMSFDRLCGGLLLAPIGSTGSAQAIFRVLTGKSSPSGRLAVSCYHDTDKYFHTLRAYKDAERNKIGVFYGYKHYDTSGLSAKYPFGFGLSYGKFVYGKVRYTGKGIRIKVKNKSSIAAAEVVQLYVGKRTSSLLRPKKELKAFKKVHLRPGRSAYVYFDWKDLDLSVWNEKAKKWSNEGGRYEFYVCSSCKKVQASGTFTTIGETLEKDGKKLSSYISNCSNIRSCGYYLDVPVKIPPQSDRKRKAALTFSVIMFCLDFVYGYFQATGWLPREWWVYTLVGLLNALPIGNFIYQTVKKKKLINKYLEESMKQKKTQREELNIDELADEIPYEALFEEEFAPVYAESAEEIKETKQERVERVHESVPFDKELTLTLACEQLSTYITERGVSLDVPSARKLLAAISASRLLVLKTGNDELTGKFLRLLGEYFGASTAINADGSETAELLYQRVGDTSELSPIARAFLNKTVEEGLIRVAAISSAKSGALKTTLAPVIGYIDQPDREAHVSILNGNVATDCELPDDMWFIVALAAGERISAIPKYLLDMATVVDITLTASATAHTRPVVEEIPVVAEAAAQTETAAQTEETQATETVENAENAETAEPVETVENVETVATAEPMLEVEAAAEPAPTLRVVETVIETPKTPVKKLVYPQLKKLVENACREYELAEVLWKRVDKLEEYVNDCNEYRIENKLWQRMEKYVAVYLATGGEAEEALDAIVANQLVYGMLPCVAESKKPLEDKFAHTLENIFGEGHLAQTLKAVKDEGLGV